jgi:hypothetical protein
MFGTAGLVEVVVCDEEESVAEQAAAAVATRARSTTANGLAMGAS